MSSITAQQTKLDLELVPKEKRLDIDVPKVYMHQFWDSVYKHDTFYRFRIKKKKRFKLNLEVFRDIFKIYPRVQGQDFDALPTDEEIMSFLRDLGKSKRVKRPAKKSTKPPARGVVIRETPDMPLSKKKEKVDVTRGKGIELLSDVALTKEAHEGTGVKPGVPDVTEEESSESEAESWGNDEGDSNNEQDSSGEDSDQKNESDDNKTQSDNENELDSEHETNENESDLESDQEEDEDSEEEVKDKLVITTSNDSDNEDETNITDKAEGDEDEEMDYITSQLYDDVDIRLNEPVDTDKEFVQEEGTDAAMTNIQQGNENPEILQVIEDAYVTLSTIP
ncbi:hypothetical protein Tco_0343277 [Tanacetum coccineum]